MTQKLSRRLSLIDCTAVVIGSTIGTGIFIVPGSIAQSLPRAEWILSVWVITGLLTFCGAMAFAELGAMIPSTGGQYVYLREAYGPLCAFLCGWAFLLIIQSGTIAAKAAGFAIYLLYLAPLHPVWGQIAALSMIALLTFVNYRGVRFGARVQNIFTLLKLTGLATVIIGAYLAQPVSRTATSTAAPFQWSHFGVAMVACLFAYEGWNKVTFIAGEIQRPEQNLKRSLVLGLAVVIGVYLLANLSYLRVLPIDEIASTRRVAALAAERAMGAAGAVVVTLSILVSIIGSTNGGMMTTPRVYFAMARDGLFFKQFGEVHPRFQTPAFAILLQGVWAAVLTLSGSFDALASYAIFSAWLFYALTVAAVIVLRRKQPEMARPYRMWGYPFTAILFVVVSLWLVSNTVVSNPWPSLIGIAIIGSGVPAYFLLRRAAAVPEERRMDSI
ncbi:MAG TPA: amino acid permease [Bryobacteraceae bacterium]|nr:amino acid permease [Bryobacteraceae bacterium]